MITNQHLRGLALALLGSFTFAAAIGGGACGDSVPSDQGSSTSSSGGSHTTSGSTSSSGTTTSSSSGGTGGAGTGGAGTGGAGTGGAGTGGAPDCYPNPTTYVEIINACTTAQKVDVSPVLPLLGADGGLPALP